MPEKDDRLSRLEGALAGLFAGYGARALAPAAYGLGALSEWKEKRIPVNEKKLQALAEKFREHLKVDPIKVVPGKFDAFMQTRVPRLAEKFPWLYGVTKEQIEKYKIKAAGRPDYIMSTGSPSSLAHEMGHAKKLPSFLDEIDRLMRTSPHARRALIGLGVGLGLSDSDIAQTAAPLVASAPYTIPMIEEARASIHGTRAMKGAAGLTPAVETAARSVPALMTYAIPALAAIMAPLVAHSVWKHLGQDKEAAAKQLPKVRKSFKVTGRLKVPAPSKWTPSAKLKQPKSSKLGPPKKGKVKTSPKLKPPSKKKYYSDLLKRLQDQRYGTRTML